jgi:CRP/FNR family cyclic AMP-dependent transcriptional regulator
MGTMHLPPSGTEIRVLEEDADLAAGLPPEQARIAAQRATARTEILDDQALNAPAGRWDGAIGLLVVEGLLIRTLSIGDRTSTELLGSGDLLRPWQRDDDWGILPCRGQWRVLERTRVAVLDERFAAAIAPWPPVWSALMARTMRRNRSQAVAMALSHLNRVDQRLLLVFWHFAERWGRVRSDGVVLRLPLTHETLGALVGARRPSVTSALSQLTQAGLLLRGDARGEWVLTNAARDRVLDETGYAISA